MLRSSSKTKMFGALVSLAALPVLCALSASAAQVTKNTNFQVNVADALAVSITTPDNWATGDIDEFLRNHIVLSVTTNAENGYTASMTTKTANTNLVNTRNDSYIIPTLGSDDVPVSSFPANYWGYSLADSYAAVSNSDEYNPLVGAGSTPITINESIAPVTNDTKHIYFGAKANATKASGTYASTVVISVVTGVIDDDEEINNEPNPDYNPTIPENPATDDNPTNTPTYHSNDDRTTYTTVTHNNDDTTTTTTEVTSGDTRAQYANPQGVNSRKVASSTSVNETNTLGTGLAITAAVAGATGFIFFLVGKRRKDDDEEDENAGGEQPPIQQ